MESMDIKNKCSKSIAIKMWRWYNCSQDKGWRIGGMGMAKVVCESCETIFQYDVVKDMKVCPVCGKPLWEEKDGSVETIQGKTNWYYYKDSSDTLTTTLYEDETPLYIFEAVDVEDAKRQLKEVMPNSPLFPSNSDNKVRCPYCQSTDVQIVPKKFRNCRKIIA